jgi:hypothetical protein
MKYFRNISIVLPLLFCSVGAVAKEAPTVESVFAAIVGVTAEITADARTANSLGAVRDGNGVVISSDGLVLTIGYLILEAEWVVVTTWDGRRVSAHIVAYDHATGFGLVRAEEPLGIAPMPLGDSDMAAAGFQALAAGSNGPRFAQTTKVVSRRTFTGYWEYLLEDAIFTMPPYAVYGGAALIDPLGQLIGIGSLMVNDAAGPGEESLGNMFVPINRSAAGPASRNPGSASIPWRHQTTVFISTAWRRTVRLTRPVLRRAASCWTWKVNRSRVRKISTVVSGTRRRRAAACGLYCATPRARRVRWISLPPTATTG